jgi:hypothetical protein
LIAANPQLKRALNIREKTGRPSVSQDQPEILKAIIDIFAFTALRHKEDDERTKYAALKRWRAGTSIKEGWFHY